ncbi:MAG: ATP-binding protein [Ignavibacteria bacterium]|nr:ATP-binding protein [Ignavibacteria bacterium]
MNLLGKRVRHPKYGEGIVVDTNYNDYFIFVEIPENGKFRFRIDEVEIIEANSIPSIGGNDNRQKILPEPPDENRRIIEALRLGIVPADYVIEFTFGRENEIQTINDSLNNDESKIILIDGEYGSGKTHLLSHIYYTSLNNNFAVSFVSIDPNETPFHKPKSIYHYLVRNFKYLCKNDKKVKGFRDFLKEAIVQNAFKDNIYFKHITLEANENLWNWIEASSKSPKPILEFGFYGYYSNPYPGLYDTSSAANIYCYLISSLSWAAKEVLGLNGLLLIFDEAENIETVNNKRNYFQGLNFLKALVYCSMDFEFLLNLPFLIDIEFDFCKQGLGKYVPFLFKLPSGLKLIFATTNYYTNSIYDEFNSLVVHLDSLPFESIKQAIQRIYEFYFNSYNSIPDFIQIEPLFEKEIFDKQTRLTFKTIVEIFDLVRFYGVQAVAKYLENELK